MENRGVQVAGAHSSMSSRLTTPDAALRSTSLSSPSLSQLVVPPRVEVIELVDPVENITDELLEEDARCDSDLAAKRTSH